MVAVSWWLRVSCYSIAFALFVSSESQQNVNGSKSQLETNDLKEIGQSRWLKAILDSNNDCKSLRVEGMVHQRWVIGENAMNGLSNQLIGIYSYVPVARLWNTNLVVGDIFSRSTFETKVEKYSGWITVPFSSFFDWSYFHAYWLQRGLVTVQLRDFKESCAHFWPVNVVERNPAFWCQKDQVLIRMLQRSGITYPLSDEKMVLQFDAVRPKFTGLYNFWKGGLKNKLQLLRVHRSLQPAEDMRLLVDLLLYNLPRDFFAVHVRLEGDYLLYEKEKSFEDELQAALTAIKSHRCVKEYLHTNGRLPAVYVASGIFNGSIAASTEHQKRGERLIEALTSVDGTAADGDRASVFAGFHRVYTREILLESIAAQNHGGSGVTTDKLNENNEKSATKREDLYHRMQHLLPEQAAFVDLLISRSKACSCFIPSHYESSFSYMVQRMKSLDRDQVLRYTEIDDVSYGKSQKFKQWGV